MYISYQKGQQIDEDPIKHLSSLNQFRPNWNSSNINNIKEVDPAKNNKIIEQKFGVLRGRNSIRSTFHKVSGKNNYHDFDYFNNARKSLSEIKISCKDMKLIQNFNQKIYSYLKDPHIQSRFEKSRQTMNVYKNQFLKPQSLRQIISKTIRSPIRFGKRTLQECIDHQLNLRSQYRRVQNLNPENKTFVFHKNNQISFNHRINQRNKQPMIDYFDIYYANKKINKSSTKQKNQEFDSYCESFKLKELLKNESQTNSSNTRVQNQISKKFLQEKLSFESSKEEQKKQCHLVSQNSMKISTHSLLKQNVCSLDCIFGRQYFLEEFPHSKSLLDTLIRNKISFITSYSNRRSQCFIYQLKEDQLNNFDQKLQKDSSKNGPLNIDDIDYLVSNKSFLGVFNVNKRNQFLSFDRQNQIEFISTKEYPNLNSNSFFHIKKNLKQIGLIKNYSLKSASNIFNQFEKSHKLFDTNSLKQQQIGINQIKIPILYSTNYEELRIKLVHSIITSFIFDHAEAMTHLFANTVINNKQLDPTKISSLFDKIVRQLFKTD